MDEKLFSMKYIIEVNIALTELFLGGGLLD
jgi:hypothetical protein